jgi:hypothetical protein
MIRAVSCINFKKQINCEKMMTGFKDGAGRFIFQF